MNNIRKRNILRPQKLLFLAVSCLFIFFTALTSLSTAQNIEHDFSIQDPYPVAVDKFLDAVSGAVAKEENNQEVSQWAEGFGQRLPEFLQDMIMVTEEMYRQPPLKPDLAPVEKFVAKWDGIMAACPNCENLSLLVEPIVEEFFADFPRLRERRTGDTPFQKYFEMFQLLEALNPWGVGGFFRVEPLHDFSRSLNIFEVRQEKRTAGYEKFFIAKRETREVENNQVLFSERIEGNKVMEVDYLRDPITIMHESLMRLRQGGGDPDLISRLDELVSLIDEKLHQVREEGLLEDFSYYYFFDQRPVTNDVIYTRHPLLKDPYIKDFKVSEFYPRQYEAANSSSSAQSNPPPPPPAFFTGVIPTAESFAPIVENATGVWTIGIFFPMYLMTLGSFIFKGLFF